MARWRGTTAERGYGNDHQRERERRLAAYRPGDPCAMGGEPLWQPPKELDVPHDHANGGYLPGLACRPHNRGEGASRGNHGRGFVLAAIGSDVRCKVCGQPYSRAARTCEICGAHYHPSHGEQRTCGRACGVELRRRNHGTAGKPRKPRPPCQVCGRPCASLQQAYCSKTCRSQARAEASLAFPSSPIHTYVCRYCGRAGVTKVTGQQREVCPRRECQLARLAANNLRVRNGLTREDADEQMRVLVSHARDW